MEHTSPFPIRGLTYGVRSKLFAPKPCLVLELSQIRHTSIFLSRRFLHHEPRISSTTSNSTSLALLSSPIPPVYLPLHLCFLDLFVFPLPTRTCRHPSAPLAPTFLGRLLPPRSPPVSPPGRFFLHPFLWLSSRSLWLYSVLLGPPNNATNTTAIALVQPVGGP